MAKTTNTTRYARYKSYSIGTIYHIYNRGNGKQNIFRDEHDYRFYLDRLEKYLKKHKVTLLCYVLMPNHIHLVLKQETIKPIYKFISSLHTSYSMYFNKKYEHVGHLFQDRFKQVIIETDGQLIHLSRYVHLNPLQAGLVKSTEEYAWSSYKEYMGASPRLCQTDIIENLIDQNVKSFPKKYAEFCKASLTEEEVEILKEVVPETF